MRKAQPGRPVACWSLDREQRGDSGCNRLRAYSPARSPIPQWFDSSCRRVHPRRIESAGASEPRALGRSCPTRAARLERSLKPHQAEGEMEGVGGRRPSGRPASQAGAFALPLGWRTTRTEAVSETAPCSSESGAGLQPVERRSIHGARLLVYMRGVRQDGRGACAQLRVGIQGMPREWSVKVPADEPSAFL